MQRMPLVNVPADIEARLNQLGGRSVNLYRALANHPLLLSSYIEFAWALRKQCQTPRRLRELMIVRGSEICGSAYELQLHAAMARAAGVSATELANLANWRQTTSFTQAERAALKYMEEMLDLAVTDATVADLKRYFSDSERVELTLTAALYAMVPRVLDALGVPLDQPADRLEIDR
jgi:4-carboxymuconolactone decarboxylase